MKDIVLSCDNLLKQYPVKKGMFNKVVGQKNVVDHVSLELEKGKTLAIVGESGCGKTVLTRVMLGIEDKTDGSIVFEGKSVDDMTPQEKSDMKAKIQMIFQDTLGSLHPRMSIRESLEEPLILNGVKDKEEREKIILDTLSQVGMAPMFLDRYPHQLSGGMRQRVMIAMALACQPKLLIADEPTTALDVTIQAQILKLMNELKAEKGTAILFITHDLGVINEMADDVAVMYCGQVVEMAPVRKIFGESKYLHPYTEGLLYSIPRLDTPTGVRLEAIPGAVPHPLDLPKGCKFAPRCKYATDKCREMEPELTELEPGHKVRCFYPKKGERN